MNPNSLIRTLRIYHESVQSMTLTAFNNSQQLSLQIPTSKYNYSFPIDFPFITFSNLTFKTQFHPPITSFPQTSPQISDLRTRESRPIIAHSCVRKVRGSRYYIRTREKRLTNHFSLCCRSPVLACQSSS